LYKITLKGNTLKLNCKSRTLRLAEIHNKRILIGYHGPENNIDPSKSHLNEELVTCDVDFTSKAISFIKNRGLDLNHYSYKKKNRGFAIEFLFSVTHGFNCDFYSLYSDCLTWLENYYPECPIIHAIIHFDEGTPHMHVLLVPLLNGNLQADKIKRFKSVNYARNRSLFEFLGKKYGLSPHAYLKGAAKKKGAELAYQAYKKLNDEQVRAYLDNAIVQSINARPEIYLNSFGIPLDEAMKNIKTTPT